MRSSGHFMLVVHDRAKRFLGFPGSTEMDPKVLLASGLRMSVSLTPSARPSTNLAVEDFVDRRLAAE
jgi:hypothetical protein